MRCDLCPLGSDDDVCPEAEGKYGIEHKDGVLGCKHPRNWAEKRDKEYCDHLGEMGTDMGIEMSLSEIDMKFLIETCEHMIGLDYKRPYCRHGKAFYKPYRNYYCASEKGDPLLDYLSKISLVAREAYGEGVWYTLTSAGLKWLGRQLKITIRRRKMAEKEYINLYECRDDFYTTVLDILSEDSTNDRANQIIDAFDYLPVVDVAPVRHGHWIRVKEIIQCDICGFGLFPDGYFFENGECTHSNEQNYRLNYCPNCGAKMDKES